VTADLPFEFRFDGYTFTRVLISSNGYLTFGDDATQWTNAPIPSASAPNLFIAPYWDDLNPKAGGTIYYTTLGAAPNRRFVAEWNAVPRYSTSGVNNGEGALTFQAILHEGTNEITFQYLSMTGAAATGGSATVGLEYGGGTSGVQHSYNLPFSIHDGGVIRFIPSAGATPTPDPALKCLPDVYYFPLSFKNH
jgi:Nidogen-like